MLADLYVEAFKVYMDLADQVWELWHEGVITDDLAAIAWSILALDHIERPTVCRIVNDWGPRYV
jgi:hypothetical protein